MAAAAWVSGCGATASRQTRYAGDVVPQGACGIASHGTLTVIGANVAFTPSDGVILLRGDLTPDGSIHAQLETAGAGRAGDALAPGGGAANEAKPGALAPGGGAANAAKPGAAKPAPGAKPAEPRKPFVMTLTAKLADETISGTYATPRCTFAVTLARVHPPLF